MSSSTVPPATSVQPPWTPPAPLLVTHKTGLKMMNSLTRNKEEFITMDGSNRVIWYMCGPTVYAPSHMGHARTYLGFDIIRRILTDYFSYDITLVMNITDIDDKILERSAAAGQHHLELSSHWEAEFHQDMQDLGVLTPTVITRVTEYMPEICQYIANIIDKDLAYESNGSVYFHVEAFEATDNMHYCKLEPEQIRNAALLQEGEGKLSQTHAGDKRSDRDFALWKKSKDGEASWESPWGPGRPGWHIECSVMASDILRRLTGTNQMDLHSGGIDLRFPHHDNEMAQAEAECGCPQWVNYFVHAGHLNIKGLKMSKSLKNFVTIQEALQDNTARQIRMLFLLHKYNVEMDYGDNTMVHALDTERRFAEFFHNAKACLRQYSLAKPQKWSQATMQLQKVLSETQRKVDLALKDDFDTPTVMAHLTDLVKACNIYINSTDSGIVGLVVQNVAQYVTRIFTIFGLIRNDGFGFESVSGGSGSESRDKVLEPVLDALLQFRTAVRDQARSGDTKGVLQACDGFRDDVLPPLGIRLEDKGETSVWKLADPAELMREMEQRQLEATRKAQAKAAQMEADAKKEALNKLSPADYFKQLTLDDSTTLAYSKFDEATGLPTHDATGEPLNKNQSKKVQKLFKGQQTKYEKYLKQQEGSSL